MQTVQFQCGTILVSETCTTCGIVFAMPLYYANEKRRTGAGIWCPNGDSLTYGKGENQKLREQVTRLTASVDQERARARDLVEQRDAAERRVIAHKGVVTRLKNRAARGICPCCDQHFPDLETHMRETHPEYEQQPEPEPDAES